MGVIQTIGQGYQIMGQEAKQKVIDNRANIFTGISVVGTIATGVVSAFAGAKSARQIDAKAAEIGRPLNLKEKAKLCWKNFIGPVGAGIGASAGAIGSNRIMAGDIARLTTDVTMATKALNEWKKASNEVMTEKQQEEMRAAKAQKDIAAIDQKTIDTLPEPGPELGRAQLFKDTFSGIVFFSTVDRVMLAGSRLKDKMKELKPRANFNYYSTAIHGVHYYEWLKLVLSPEDQKKYCDGEVSIYHDYGWNKGYQYNNVDDDDDVGFYLAPGEVVYHGEPRSCFTINWEHDPSDMRLGDMLKNSGI